MANSATLNPKMWENSQIGSSDNSQVGSSEGEVICGIGNDCIIFPNVNTAASNPTNTGIYPVGGAPYEFLEQDVFNIQVTEEEVICESWGGDQIANEEIVQTEMKFACNPTMDPEEVEIPLPQDQDTYTTMRPYPCDFCSRRFRKKANLMNHMVAHQTDRPHGCNLCGARYRRKCDLINHMKIHAYAPGRDLSSDADEEEEEEEEEEEDPALSPTQNNIGNRGRRKKAQSVAPRKRKNYSNSVSNKRSAPDDTSAHKEGKRQSVKLSSRKKYANNNSAGNSNPAHNYVEEDVKLLKQSAPSFVETQYDPPEQSSNPPRWPVVDETRPYVCQHCGVGFAREKALGSHARIHAGDSPFECNTCGEMFWDVGLLREHVKTKHPGRYEYEPPYTGDDRFGEFHCETCGLGFHRQDLLKRHRRVHVKVEPNTEEYSHVCQVCGKQFPCNADLLTHVETHARYQPHRCMLCGECFMDGSAVAAHVRKRHAKTIPPNACTLCGKTCRDRRSLQKHSWVHSAERCFPCHKCGKRFHSRARLKRHMVSHRDKAVTCDECGEEFPDGRALINHRHSHNKDTSGRQFPCVECGKTFGSRSSQQIHARIHTGERPYGCRFCWKAFADGGTLRKHERIHTGEKPYACPICPRAFNQRVVLREHIRSHHSGPEPRSNTSHIPVYACKVCAGTFSRSEELCAHLIKHSDENTAKHRMPKMGPRKYRRRRKLNPHELNMISGGSENLDSGDKSDKDSDDSIKRKIIKKKYKPKAKTNTNDNLKSVVENFNSVVDTKGDSLKKKHKTKSKVIANKKVVNNSVSIVGQSKTGVSKSMSGGFLKSTRPVGQGRIRPRTKNVTVSTLAALKAVSEKQSSESSSRNSPDSSKVRPRTKNVNYHNVKMAKLQTAKFPVNTKSSAGKSKAKPKAKRALRKGREHVENVENGSLLVEPDEDMDENKEVKLEFTCEMCSETFTKRSELLVHVPIHI